MSAPRKNDIYHLTCLSFIFGILMRTFFSASRISFVVFTGELYCIFSHARHGNNLCIINFVIDSHDSLSEQENIKRAIETKEFNDTEFYTVDSLKTAREIIEQALDVDKAYLIGGATTLIRAIINNSLDKLILTTFNKSYFKDSEDPVYLNLDSTDFVITDCRCCDNGKIEYLSFKKD